MIVILIVFSFFILPNFIHSSVVFIRNPNCNDSRCHEPNQPSFFYANHPIDNTMNHMIYSSFDQLTIMFFQTSLTSKPVFNYEALFNGNYTAGMDFPDSLPTNSLVLVIRRLIEFNDSNDNGVMSDDPTTMKSYYLANLNRTNVTIDQTEQPNFQYNISELQGTLSIDVVYPGAAIRDTKFPKLRTEPSSYYFNIVLQAQNYTFVNPRFAFEFYLMSPGKEGFITKKSRFIDDQYTPGSFNVWELKANPNSNYPSSMLWKPIVYLTDDRSVEDNTLMQIYDLKNNITRNPNIDQGMFLSLFRQPYISSMNISIGASTDGFFNKENYGFLQFTAGLDDLKPDATAQFVTAAVIISFALPIIVGIVAVIIIIKRRFSREPSRVAYAEINN